LPKQGAVFHVVVGVDEDLLNHIGAHVFAGVQFLERGEQVVVDEFEHAFPGDAFGVGGPVAPAVGIGDGRGIVILHQFVFLLLVVEDFEEDQPDELGDALGIAVDPGILAHDVLNGFDGVG